MTLGGFTAAVRITKTRVSGGFNHERSPYVDADMEFEGKLLIFHYGQLKENLRSKANASVSIEIEFTDKQDLASNGEDGYIGTIQLREEKDEVSSYVRVTLPISMFPVLRSMQGETIKFETIHDIVRNPNENQKTDNIVALVKRIYFETVYNIEEEPPKKRSSISFVKKATRGAGLEK